MTVAYGQPAVPLRDFTLNLGSGQFRVKLREFVQAGGKNSVAQLGCLVQQTTVGLPRALSHRVPGNGRLSDRKVARR